MLAWRALQEGREPRQEAGEQLDGGIVNATCRQCGKPMNPVEVMLGPVCGTCCKANQKAATR